MIARTWRAEAAGANAEAYRSHFATKVAPHLKELTGHRGAWLLKREADKQVEFLALTLWESMEAVRQFAGADPDVAVVEPEARQVLAKFDEFVRHYEVAWSADG
jgi:heme-degrading monooxygenase HmoA